MASVPPGLPPGPVRAVLSAAGASAAGPRLVRLEASRRRHVVQTAVAVGKTMSSKRCFGGGEEKDRQTDSERTGKSRLRCR